MNYIEKIIYEETSKRLEKMSRKDYQFPTRIKKSDWIVILFLIFVNTIFIILCMLGVIV